MRQVFPGARFLVNTRDHGDVLRSKWWAKGDVEANAEALAGIERRILAPADPTVLRGLFEWLGEPWDEEAVRLVLAVRHSV